MSILTEVLPDYVFVRDKRCPIATDFKVWLKLSELIGRDMPEAEKLVQMLKLVFFELPPNLNDGVMAMMDFYGHVDKSDAKQENTVQKSYFDFEYDADLIYAAFFQQYKIDLCSADMHWWKFKALLGSLSEDTHFIKVVQFRSMDTSKIKDKEQKKFYLSMKARYKLPDKRSEEQKEQQLNAALESLF